MEHLEFLKDFEPVIVEDLDKYGAGSVPGDLIPSLRDQEHNFPTFALNLVSLDKSTFCFNNSKLTIDKFLSLLDKCKKLSDSSYRELIESDSVAHRFHFVEPYVLKRCGLWKKLCHLWHIKPGDKRENELPDIYQFGLYTNADNGEAPRILGFIGRWGVFYMLWFDVDHQVYPRRPENK